jgi:hypothetical protein
LSRDNFPRPPPGVDQARMSAQALHFPKYAHSPHVGVIPCKLKPCDDPNAGSHICFVRPCHGEASDSFQLKST